MSTAAYLVRHTGFNVVLCDELHGARDPGALRVDLLIWERRHDIADISTGIVLKAGEELRVPKGRAGEPSHFKVDAERKLEWATGWLVFERATIGEVVNELNRRNAVQIKIE